MRAARILGAIGRFLIGTGIIMLLFVAYQLWGTGLQHAQAQDDLENDFETLLDSAPADVEPIDAAAVATDDPVVGDADETPATADAGELFATVDREYVELLYPPDGDVLGKIDIPRIGLDEFFVEGVGVADLRKGPGHYRNTPLPGQAGNASIAGHRTTYGAPFHRIDELEPGDEIKITTLQGTFTYRVMPQVDGSGESTGHFIVSPNDTQVLGDFGDDRLTLTACHPKYSARQRIIVVAELVDDAEAALPRPEELADYDAARAEADLASEAVTESPDDDGEEGDRAIVAAELPDDDFGEGLNGDRSAIPPAVAWMAAALAVWLTAGFIGRRWHILPSYALALIPFLLLLFMSFVHIDQALPSY
jgi:sortase A